MKLRTPIIGSHSKKSLADFLLNPMFKEGSKRVPFPEAFYFRLTEKNLYYTETKSDTRVLGAIAIHNIVGTKSAGETCFAIDEEEVDPWTLCAADAKTKQEWICTFNEI
jgi:hypothetical protein